MGKTLIVGIHGSDHPLHFGPMVEPLLQRVLTDYRTGKGRVLVDIDVTRAHITYMHWQDA